MAARARELIEDVVWGTGAVAGVYAKTIVICREHVSPMLLAVKVIRELREWANQQGKEHYETWMKIMRIETEMQGCRDGVTMLMNHHRDISNRYYEAASAIWAVLYDYHK